MDTSSHLSGLERWLLALPLVAGVVFGLFPLLAPAAFAALTGFPGNDPFILEEHPFSFLQSEHYYSRFLFDINVYAVVFVAVSSIVEI